MKKIWIKFYDILKKGSETARETASETLSGVKRAMGINYF